MNTDRYNLVADIGGTNARFAMVVENSQQLLRPKNLKCADYPTLVDAVENYLEEAELGRPVQATMSIASPVTLTSFASHVVVASLIAAAG